MATGLKSTIYLIKDNPFSLLTGIPANNCNTIGCDDPAIVGSWSTKSVKSKHQLQKGGKNITKLKDAATDMRYFARSEFSRNLVHKKNFSLLGYVFCQER